MVGYSTAIADCIFGPSPARARGSPPDSDIDRKPATIRQTAKTNPRFFIRSLLYCQIKQIAVQLLIHRVGAIVCRIWPVRGRRPDSLPTGVNPWVSLSTL